MRGTAYRFFLLSIAFFLALSGCGGRDSQTLRKAQYESPQIIERGDSALGQPQTALLSNHHVAVLEKDFSGNEWTYLQLIVSDRDFKNFHEDPQGSEKLVSALQKVGVRILKKREDLGFYVIGGEVRGELVEPRLSGLELPFEVVIEALYYEKGIGRPKTVDRNSAAETRSDWNYLRGTGLYDFLENTRKILGSESTGAGVKVGIVDTGISSNHPAFRNSLDGKSRIRRMIDTTTEGDVVFSPTQTTQVEVLDLKAKRLRLRGETAVSDFSFFRSYFLPALGEDLDLEILASDELLDALTNRAHALRLGVLEEKNLQSVDAKNDLNGNGKTQDKFIVLQFGSTPEDSLTFIDFEGQNDFRSVKGLRDFNHSGQKRLLGNETIGIAVDNLDPIPGTQTANSPFRLNLVGLDPNGHGTHVASVAAGASFVADAPLATTPLRGLAPEALLYVARAIRTDGHVWGAYDAILNLADAGVDIINLSFASLEETDSRSNRVLPLLMSRLSRDRGIQFVVAAGNEGPGSESISSLAQSAEALTVAALIHPKLLNLSGDFSSSISDWMPIGFSSRGPGPRNSFHPKISAPGLAIAALPMTQVSEQKSAFQTLRGTSMAAPLIAGALALLDSYQRKAYPMAAPLSKADLARVLMESAETSRDEKVSWIDTGTGLARLDRALELLKKIHTSEAGEEIVSSIDRIVFSPSVNTGPEKQIFEKALRVTLLPGEEKCRSVWIARRGKDSLKIATTMDTYEIQWIGPVLTQSVIHWSTLDGSQVRFWKNLGLGVDEYSEDEGNFKPRPENRLQICFDGKKAEELGPGLHGLLLKLSLVNPDSGETQSLPFAYLPVTIEVQSPLEDGNTAVTWSTRIQHPLGTQKIFQVLEDTLWAEARFRTKVGSTHCSAIEASLMPPMTSYNREKIYRDNIDVMRSCSGRPWTRFAIAKPVPGQWSVGLQSLESQADFTEVETRIRTLRGHIDRAFEGAEALNSKFSWNMDIKSADFENENFRAYISIQGEERNIRLLTQAPSISAPPSDDSTPFVCMSPHSRSKSLEVATKLANPQSASYRMEILECPAGILNAGDPQCRLVESSLSVGGDAKVGAKLQWGQNYCVRASSATRVPILVNLQLLSSEEQKLCQITKISDGSSLRKISCNLELSPPEGSVSDTLLLAKMKVVLEAGHFEIYRDVFKLSR
jgi:subtilisin family serine protease